MTHIRKRCRVCLSGTVIPFQSIQEHHYWRCRSCAATLMDESCLPNRDKEHQYYQIHENDPNDQGYQQFLSQLADPLLKKLSTSQVGLDYGCGPGPALAQMLNQAGHRVHLYDPCFHPNPSVLTRTYDFIVCTETAEHFHHPYEEFQRINRLLKPGGWLGIMTTFQTDDQKFVHWHYRRDFTHVVFYRKHTFHQLAKHFDWHIEIPQKNLVFIQKKISYNTH